MSLIKKLFSKLLLKKHSENLKDREHKKDYLSELSVLSNLKLQRRKGDFCPINIDKRFDEGIKEVLESY